MNLDQLRGFLEVADTGHFTRAAERLHVAQPSLSRQISTLEKELGADLFHRARGNIGLTPAGHTLLPRARRMLADADAIRVEMAELAGLQRGRVRLGATPTLCVSLVAEAMSVFHTSYPRIELQILEGGSHLLIEQLGAGAIDLALITATDLLSDAAHALVRTPLLLEDLVVVSSPELEPVADGPIGLAQLAELPLIALAESYDLRSATDAALRAAGLRTEPVVEGAEMDAVLRFVERGLGVAVVPATVLMDRPGLRSVPLNAPQLARTISIAHRSDVNPTPAAAAMRRVILASAAALAAASPETLRLASSPEST